MKPMTIIMLGMSSQADWDQGILNRKLQKVQGGAVNRNYHVLQHVLKRPEVARIIHVDFLPFTPRKMVKEFLQAELWRSTPQTKDRGLTWRLDQRTDKWWSLACLRLSDLLQLKTYILPETELVVWSYHPIFPQVFGLFSGATKVFDTVDNWAEHSAYVGMKQQLLDNYQHITQTADVIFTVSPELKKLFTPHRNVTWIPNGVDVEHFSSALPTEKFSHLKQPFAVYVGVIQERLDAELLEQVAKLTPSVQFVLAGPVWEGTPLAGLKALDNVHFIGPVPYQELPQLFSQASVGIIPHRVNRFTASMNPLKLYEYLASGLPVVSTPVQGTEQFSAGVQVRREPKEFSQAVLAAVQISPEDKTKLKQLVQDQTWDKRVEQMIKAIQA